MKTHQHFISTDYQCSPQCPAHNQPEPTDALVHVDTPTEARRALDAYPRNLAYALEGKAHYQRMVWETHLALTFWALTPWRWFNTEGQTMTDHEAIARLGSNGDTEELA